MRKPRPDECYDDTTDNIDWECYHEAADRYADEKRDELFDRKLEERDSFVKKNNLPDNGIQRDKKYLNGIITREYIISEIIDILFNVYKIDKNVAIDYVKGTNKFMDNVINRIEEAIAKEVEELVSTTNILQHQKTF